MTFTHAMGFNAAKYSADFRISSSEVALAIGPMRTSSLRAPDLK